MIFFFLLVLGLFAVLEGGGGAGVVLVGVLGPLGL